MTAKERVNLNGFLVSIHQVMRRCSKKNCKCARGLLHGPYWIARIKTDSGKRASLHLGKQLPPILAELKKIAQS